MTLISTKVRSTWQMKRMGQFSHKKSGAMTDTHADTASNELFLPIGDPARYNTTTTTTTITIITTASGKERERLREVMYGSS
ncbi:hypothetical protein ACOMHN_003277 [Nucella lapillus]